MVSILAAPTPQLLLNGAGVPCVTNAIAAGVGERMGCVASARVGCAAVWIAVGCFWGAAGSPEGVKRVKGW